MEDLSEEKVVKLCICRACSSFVNCNEKIGYCYSSIGKSKCIIKAKGCICGGCPVRDKMGLKNMYYCIKGSEKEQTK